MTEWTDAWAYYLGASYTASDKQGSNYKLLPTKTRTKFIQTKYRTYSQELAGDIDGYDTDAFEGNKLKPKLVDCSIKMSHLLTHHIQVNNTGICMERTQLIDIVQTF